MLQRFLDIVLCASALLVLSPLWAFVMVVLRLTGEREVFFRQQRIGLGGQHFDLLKFATMMKESPNMGTGTVTLKDDPRVLPLGRVLRKTKVNELPQLLNVLKGDMSLIGPRPQTPRCFDAFPEQSQRAIVTVRPGLSGVGSIVFRAEEDMMHSAADPDRFYDEFIMPYKGQLEEWYVGHQGVGIYLLLIFLTVWVVVCPGSKLMHSLLPELPAPPAAIIAAQAK